MNASDKATPVIGLVGGVCSGKSTAAAEFAALGCRVIDADAIGWELLAAPEVRHEIRKRWGERVFDAGGSVDREVLAGIVFQAPPELAALNGITRGRIRSRIEEAIAEARRDPAVPAIVLDAAIMMEAGWDKLCTAVVFVSAADEVRAQRAAARGWGRKTWQARENSQISLDRKAGDCYCELDNSSSVSHLRDQVHQVYRRILHRES